MASAGFYRFFRDISSQTQQRMVNIGSSMQSVFDNINGISTSNNNDTTLTTNNSPVNNSTVNVNEQSSINTNLCENSSPTNSTTECKLCIFVNETSNNNFHFQVQQISQTLLQLVPLIHDVRVDEVLEATVQVIHHHIHLILV